ncbi:c-type cytochrome [Pseudidiomarina mangrovi]|uniref:c-type cytochrome n=1 Tax=Pseudidiomarina mangrovi TaxID=2487133 RepID=UPI001F0C09CA|nr:cytochrome c5 family protein [Pseudidiomarina mangrovi]
MKLVNVVNTSRLLVAALAVVVGTASAAMMPQAKSTSSLEDRIAPIGKVRVAGSSPQADAGAQQARSGDAVYNQFCAACHTSGVLNAPKLNNAADWEPRLAQGMDTVLRHAIEGYNAMPAKGTCGNCSDDEIQAAIDYMIAEL